MESTRSSGSSAAAWAVALAIVGLFVVLCVHSILLKSPTHDEDGHLSSGLSILRTGDFRMGPEHPPLAKLVAAAACLPLDPYVDTESELWQESTQWAWGTRLLFEDNDAGSLILAGRLGLVVLAAVCLLLLFAYARSSFGATAALVTLTLLAFEPNFIAHARLVTTDVPACLTIALAVAAFQLALDRASWRRVLLAALAVAVALGTKLSAVMLGPAFVLLGALRVALPGEASRRERLVQVTRLLVVVGLGAWIGLWACYGFQENPMPEGRDACLPAQVFAASDLSPAKQAIKLVHDLPLVPHPYIDGLIRQGLFRNRWGYLMGEARLGGWWTYFPVALAVKTPPAVLVALLAALVLGWRERRRLDAWALACFLLPAAIYFAISITGTMNIGVRHLLPIYPLVFLAAGAVLGPVVARGGRGVRVAVALVLLSLAGSLVTTHPHYIPYFNLLAGGPERGSEWLADSNLDWGQDLPLVARFANEQGIEELYLSYFGTARPASYGIQSFDFPEPDDTGVVPFPEGAWVAISEQRLVEARTTQRQNGVWETLRPYRPVARPGWSIRVYRLEPAWLVEPQRDE